jgi:hypothetical protein
MMFERSCKHCNHRHENECRRFPPQVSVIMMPVQSVIGQGPKLQPNPVCTFPMVEDDLWCGEYAVKLSMAS